MAHGPCAAGAWVASCGATGAGAWSYCLDEDPPPITAPTASRATADPVPKAKPCIIVAPRLPNMEPPPLCCGAAAGGGGAARLAGGGGALRAGGGGERERAPDDLPLLRHRQFG